MLTPARASFTSSSLNGLTIASIFFILSMSSSGRFPSARPAPNAFGGKLAPTQLTQLRFSGSPRTGFGFPAHCFPREGRLAAGAPVMQPNDEATEKQLFTEF